MEREKELLKEVEKVKELLKEVLKEVKREKELLRRCNNSGTPAGAMR